MSASASSGSKKKIIILEKKNFQDFMNKELKSKKINKGSLYESLFQSNKPINGVIINNKQNCDSGGNKL